MRNLEEPNVHGKVASNKFFIKDTRQKPHAFRWWEPGCTPGNDGCTGDEPLLENSWAQPSPPLEKFAFRLHADGSLEFKGHLDAAGTSSGTVAVTLPGATVGDVDFLPANDQFWHTTITTDDGLTFTLALVFINAATGEITISWPAV